MRRYHGGGLRTGPWSRRLLAGLALFWSLAPREPLPPAQAQADEPPPRMGERPGVPRRPAGRPGAEREYRMAAGDIVSITVYPAEEYSREVTVQPDGKVELSLLGSILVKGLTAREMQDLLTEKYSRYVSNPQVTVAVRRFVGRRVAIIGEIGAAGYYEYRDGMRLLELVSQAGGPKDNAKLSKVVILRGTGAGGGTNVPVNFHSVLAGRLDRDPLLLPGDVVYFPKGRVTLGAQWTTTNILPWLALMTLISSIILTVHFNTRGTPSAP